MKATSTRIADVLVLEPAVAADSRGFFYESFNARQFRAATGADVLFVQDNHSRSDAGVLRGLHYQLRRPQGKLVRVVRGAIFDVAVDLRRSSPTFGKWVGMQLSEDNRLQAWVPAGFAHGFLAVGGPAEVLYKVTDYYDPADERCIAWDDPAIGVNWPLAGAPRLSGRDGRGVGLADAEVFD